MKGSNRGIIAAAIGVILSSPLQANELDQELTALATGPVQEWLNSPVVIEAVKAQNAKHNGITQNKIDELDQQWRAETKSSNQPMINSVLASDLSQYLMQVKDDAVGMYTEIFVMDNVGLNVGQSDPTSDYWQ